MQKKIFTILLILLSIKANFEVLTSLSYIDIEKTNYLEHVELLSTSLKSDTTELTRSIRIVSKKDADLLNLSQGFDDTEIDDLDDEDFMVATFDEEGSEIIKVDKLGSEFEDVDEIEFKNIEIEAFGKDFPFGVAIRRIVVDESENYVIDEESTKYFQFSNDEKKKEESGELSYTDESLTLAFKGKIILQRFKVDEQFEDKEAASQKDQIPLDELAEKNKKPLNKLDKEDVAVTTKEQEKQVVKEEIKKVKGYALVISVLVPKS